MDLGERDPGLNGQVRQGVRQGRPEALRPGQFRTGSSPVGLAQCQLRGRGIHDRHRRVVLDASFTGYRSRL